MLEWPPWRFIRLVNFLFARVLHDPVIRFQQESNCIDTIILAGTTTTIGTRTTFTMNFLCLLSAIFFFVGNVVTIVYYAIDYRHANLTENLDDYLELDPQYLMTRWSFRSESFPMYISAGILNTLAWFLFMFPVVQLSWILSQGGTKWISAHVAMAIFVLTGSLTEWIASFLYIGSSMTAQLLVQNFNLDNWISENAGDFLGWRTLEVTHVVSFGLVSIVGAIEWILMAIIMMIIHFSVRRWQRQVDQTTFGACWNALGLFISLFCILEFVTEVLRLYGASRYFNQLAFWYSASLRLVFIPTWLLILGMRLSYASLKLNQQAHMRQAADATTPAPEN